MKAAPTTLILFAMILIAGAAMAQTPDGMTPAVELVCDLESGAAFGLCNAACEAMDCHLRNDDDPLTQPAASDRACDRVEGRFLNITGRELPCKSAVVCSCFEPTNWSDAQGGQTWQDMALGDFDPARTVASDDAGGTTVISYPVESPLYGAAVDVASSSCQVFYGDDSTPALTQVIDAEEVEVCRELLRTAAGL